MNEKTGTPIKQNDANTRAVFGEYVSVYDIQQAVIDKATVPIYYESRIAKLSLNESELPKVDSEFAEITEGEEEDSNQKLVATGSQSRPHLSIRNARLKPGGGDRSYGFL